MTQADVLRIYQENARQEANEAADARRLSLARLALKRRMDEVEFRNEEESL